MVKDLDEMIEYYKPEMDEEATCAKVKKFWQVLFPELLDRACVSRTGFISMGHFAGAKFNEHDGKKEKATKVLQRVSRVMAQTDVYELMLKRFVNNESIEAFTYSNEISKGRYYVLEQMAFHDFANRLQYEDGCPLLVVERQKKSEE